MIPSNQRVTKMSYKDGDMEVVPFLDSDIKIMALTTFENKNEWRITRKIVVERAPSKELIVMEVCSVIIDGSEIYALKVENWIFYILSASYPMAYIVAGFCVNSKQCHTFAHKFRNGRNDEDLLLDFIKENIISLIV